MTPDERPVGPLLEHLFRHEHGRLVARLVRVFGPARLELAEDVVQEALAAALAHWPLKGIPDDPPAWLARVARGRALDVLRRGAWRTDAAEELERWATPGAAGPEVDEMDDDALRMMFTACHPALAPEARGALVLRTLGGFGPAEIARAFLTSEAAIKQRLVRARRALRESGVRFEVPGADEVEARLGSVLDVLYLLFNEGYLAHRGEALLRQDLVDEAVRLARLVVRHPVGDRPEAHALLALLLLTGARGPARVGGAGDLVLLGDQDRSRWDRAWIAEGLTHLRRAQGGEVLTRFHLEAGIAACHATARGFESTDWGAIVGFYELLEGAGANPLARLNRAVALAMRDGAEAGLRALEELGEPPELARSHLLFAVHGELCRRAGLRGEAATWFERALEHECTAPERALLEERLRRVR